ncbi:non-ribosomal peptide synthetase [Parasedimentitalea huanghaiensis]|uniref:Amino acid adenylation domain-containing protein n=1 Tax=Parasedimentitalea huanghaiensis TaxID=2682100 RepID=A0A6L6WL12_9RHOB|nr:non-ribosomal peptide synthetase [Zongyanglinia huanghaiensis]MVO18536.1 amino acid adenylation domain-containing protein [Zongyanglinia huanghaiensis]
MSETTPVIPSRGQWLLTQLRQSSRDGSVGGSGQDLVLSVAQKTLLASQDLHQGEAVGNVTKSWELRGRLDLAALERALQALVIRHDALRLSISRGKGRPQPVFAAHLPVRLICEEGGGEGLADRLRQIDRHIEHESLNSLPLTGDRLWKARLFKIETGRHVLMIAMHHLICDDWSWRILPRDLFVLYRSEVEAMMPALPEAGCFKTYLQQGGVGRAEETGAGTPETSWPELDWPVAEQDQSDPQARRSEVAERLLDPSGFEALKQVARVYNCTPFTFFLSCYQMLLSLYCDQASFGISVSAADRLGPGTQNSIGVLVHDFQVGLDLTSHLRFSDLLQAAKDRVHRAQQTPNEGLHLGRATIGYYNAPVLAADAGALAVRERPMPRRAIANNLRLSLKPGKQGVVITFEGQQKYFDQKQLDRLAGCYDLILQQVVKNPEILLSGIRVVSDPEMKRQAVRSVAPTVVPCDGTIVARFLEVAGRHPAAPALATPTRTQSYAELDAETNTLAHWLRQQGLEAGDRLAVALPRGRAVFKLWLGALKANLTVVPIETTLPEARIQSILQASGARMMVGAAAADTGQNVEGVRWLALPRGAECAALPKDPLPPPSAGASPASFIMFTSGTTGPPKGVPITQAGLLRLAANTRHLPVGPGDRMIQLASCGFDGSLIEVWGAWLNGAALVLCEKPILTEGGVNAELRRLAPNAAFMTTSLFNAVVDTDASVLATLNHLAVGGEAASASHFRRALAVNPSLRLSNVYGPMENGALTAQHLVGRQISSAVPIGRPLPGNMTFVLSETQQPVPDGFAGELLIGGPGLSLGYDNQPELSRQKFLSLDAGDLGLDQAGSVVLYRSGDRVKWNRQGELEFLGRRDNQFKLHGYRIEPSEIEAALMEHPAVGRVAVAPDRQSEQSQTVGIVAYYDLISDHVPTEKELRVFMAARLPRPILPTRYIPVDRLQLTPNGKADLQALERGHDRPPGQMAPVSAATDPMVELWKKHLKIGSIPEDIDYYALGGTSLSLVQMIFDVEALFGVEVDFAVLSGEPTLRRMRYMISLSPTSRSGGLRHLRVLREGDPKLPPVVILPAKTGSAAWAIDVLSQMTTNNPILALGFEPPRGRNLKPSHFADLLSAFLEDLAIYAADKPVILAGFSFGGTIAGYMAGMASAYGVEVAKVINIDGGSPVSWVVPENPANRSAFAQFMRQFRFFPTGPVDTDYHLVTVTRSFPFSGVDRGDGWSHAVTSPIHEYDLDTHHVLLIQPQLGGQVAYYLDKIISGTAIASRIRPSQYKSSWLTRLNAAKQLSLRGEYKGAADLLDQLVPDDSEKPEWMVLALIRLGQRSEPLARHWLDHLPDCPFPLVWQELAKRDDQNRIICLRQGYQASGADLSGAVPLVASLSERGDHGEVDEIIRQLQASTRFSVEAGLAQGIAFAVSGDPDQAFRSVALALAHSDASTSHFRWASMFFSRAVSPDCAFDLMDIGRSRFPDAVQNMSCRIEQMFSS